MTAHDRTVWTRTQTRKDSDVTFSAIGHFFAIFKCAPDRDIPLETVSTGSWDCIPIVSGRPRVISAFLGQNQSCVTSHHRCVTAGDRTVWTQTQTGKDFSTVAQSFSRFSSAHWTVTSHSKSFAPKFTSLGGDVQEGLLYQAAKFHPIREHHYEISAAEVRRFL